MQAASDVELLEDGGITYELTRSRKPSANNGGYEGVVKQGNLFHAKLTLARGGGQTVLPGDGLNTPQEAALRIAKYKLAPYEIEKKNPYRAAKGEGKVRRLNMGHALLLTPVCYASGRSASTPRRARMSSTGTIAGTRRGSCAWTRSSSSTGACLRPRSCGSPRARRAR